MSLLEAWSRGNFATETTDQTVQLNSNAIGRVEALDLVINLEIEDIEEFYEDTTA